MTYTQREGESLPAFAAFLLFAHLPSEETNATGQRMDRLAVIANGLQVRIVDILAWRDIHEWEARKSGGFRKLPGTVTLPRAEALLRVLDARAAQRRKWSDDHDKDHGDEMWLALLTERVGKAASCLVNTLNDTELADTVAQLGALCLAYLESRE